MKDPHLIIDRLVVTEKGTRLSAAENKYQFRIAPGANKLEIKRAVEQLFNVHVTQVNTMNRKGKVKRARTGKLGRTSDWKRAMVTLKEGESITLA
jgi:large subunit ribosomal protein L23